MSEAVNTAPAPAPAQNATPPVSAKPEEVTVPELSPAQIEKIVGNYKTKVKVDDQEHEVSFDDLRRGFQLRQASDKRMFEAHKAKEQVQKLIESVKANPKQAFKELGLDPLKFSEETLTEHIRSLKLSPEQRAMMEREAELQRREEAIRQQEEQRKAQEQAALEAQAAQQLDAELTEALQSENFPKSVYAVKRVANIMREYMVAGHTISARDAVRLAKQDIESEVRDFMDNLPPEVIEKMTPKAYENMRKAAIAKAQGGFPQPRQATPSAPRPVQPQVKKRKSLDQFLKDATVFEET